MARVNVVGMDAVLEDMKRMGELTGPVADQMLLAGAAVMKRSWKQSIQKHDFIDTHSMIDNVNFPKKPKSIQDVRTIDVYPQGKDKNGTRNAEKAFILHYGRSNMDASNFVDEAEQNAKAESDAAMEKIWNHFIEKGS